MKRYEKWEDLLQQKRRTGGLIRRLKKRAIARGKSWNAKREESIRMSFSRNEPPLEAAGMRIHSGSTGQAFRLMLVREQIEQNTKAKYSSYGLCKEGSSIPSF